MTSLNTKWQKLCLIGAMVSFPFVLNGCGAVLLGGASAGATTKVAQDSRSISTMYYDEEVERKAYEILKSNSLLSNPENLSISITTFNGNVLVTGQTINKDYLKWVVREIEQLEHVRKVYNYATLQKPVSAGVVSNDTYITSQVRGRLLLGKDIKSNRFKVVTENGNVFLMGIVTRDEAKRAINETLKIEGVRKVYHIFDYIEVQSYTANGAQSEENIVVTPVKGSESNYQHPDQVRYTIPNQTQNSSYVPPVTQQQNGGAYIMDEPQPTPTTNVQLAPNPNYQAPQQSIVPQAAPVQNGGAYLIEDTSANTGTVDLLAPAQPVY